MNALSLSTGTHNISGGDGDDLKNATKPDEPSAEYGQGITQCPISSRQARCCQSHSLNTEHHSTWWHVVCPGELGGGGEGPGGVGHQQGGAGQSGQEEENSSHQILGMKTRRENRPKTLFKIVCTSWNNTHRNRTVCMENHVVRKFVSFLTLPPKCRCFWFSWSHYLSLNFSLVWQKVEVNKWTWRTCWGINTA